MEDLAPSGGRTAARKQDYSQFFNELFLLSSYWSNKIAQYSPSIDNQYLSSATDKAASYMFLITVLKFDTLVL